MAVALEISDRQAQLVDCMFCVHSGYVAYTFETKMECITATLLSLCVSRYSGSARSVVSRGPGPISCSTTV